MQIARRVGFDKQFLRYAACLPCGHSRLCLWALKVWPRQFSILFIGLFGFTSGTSADYAFLNQLELALRVERCPMRYRKLRRPVNIPVVMRGTRMKSNACVRNISASGAKLTGAPPLQPGALLTIEVSGLTFPATCVWFRNHALGIHFETLLSPQEMSVFVNPSMMARNAIARSQAKPRVHGFRELR